MKTIAKILSALKVAETVNNYTKSYSSKYVAKATCPNCKSVHKIKRTNWKALKCKSCELFFQKSQWTIEEMAINNEVINN